MEVLYLFRGYGNIRVPFTCYNPALFRCFVSVGGKWDNVSHSFVFTGDVDTNHINKIIQMFFPTESSMIPIVQVQENSRNEPFVSGFLERPLEYAPNNDEYEDSPAIKEKLSEYSPAIKKKQTEYPTLKKADAPPNSPFSFPVSPSLPEKLSNQLKEKLEAELRSRKYSVQTRRAYIYYNRLICRTLQKPPKKSVPKVCYEERHHC